ncbi:MAG: hypothetical protein IJ811_03430 [Clostridia bacterium]|nr:hypothetical protein [Clostridia bacterium]
MIIKRVETAKDRKIFLEFANRLYKDNEYFVPTLYMNDKAVFNKNYYYYESCEAEYYLCLDDNGKPLGRISPFIQRVSNEKTGEKRARFHFFDCVNDQKVANLLFDTAVKWARERGMEKICGPLGFSDLEREGLLVEGFDKVQTFEEQYNFDYYPVLVENYGFTKEVDWIEFQVRSKYNQAEMAMVRKVRDYVAEKYGLRLAKSKNISEFLKTYADKVFDCLDESYSKLYGTVPMTEKMRKEILGQFKLVIQNDCIIPVVDKSDKVVAFGFVMPNIGEAMRLDGGHLTLRAIFKLLSILKKPKIIDLGLVGVLPEYQGVGINSFFIVAMDEYLQSHDIDHFETNLCLEYNLSIQKQWKYFDAIPVKRRRSYILEI